MAHVGLKDRFESPHSVAHLFNVVKILGSAVTAVQSVVNIVYDFVVGGNVNDHAESVNATSREEVDRFVAFVDNLLFMYPEICGHDSFSSFSNFCTGNGVNYGAVLVSERENCRLCDRKLATLPNGKEVVIYHLTRGTYLGTRFTKQCRKCKVQEHYRYFNHDGKRLFDEDCLVKEFLLSTEDTAIDINLLRYLDEEIVHGALPFQVKANVYNSVHGYGMGKLKVETGCDDNGNERSCKRKRLVQQFMSTSRLYIAVHNIELPPKNCGIV